MRPFADRAGLSARRVQRLPAPGQRSTGCTWPTWSSAPSRRGGAEPGRRGARPLGLPRPDPRRWSLPAARRARPGPADQPQPPAGRPDHRGVRRAARPPGQPPAATRAALHALQRVVADAGPLRPAGAPGFNHAPGIVGTDPAWAGWVARWHATSTLTPKVRAIIRTIMAKAGRWLAAEHPEITEPGQWTRSTCAAWVAAVDRMTVGDYAQRRDAPRRPRRGPDRPAHQGPHPHGHPHVLPRLPGMGVDRPPLRPHPGAGRAAQRRRADRHRPAGHRRRRLGQADLGRTELQAERPARHLGRQLLPAAADPRARPDLAVLRPAQRRDLPAAGRLHPLAARRAAHRRRLHRRPRRDAVCLLDVPVHKTGTAFTKPVDPLVGQAIEAWQALRPEQPTRLDRKTSEQVRPAVLRPRAPGREGLHQPLDDPGAVRQGRRPDQPTSAATSPATGPARRSPASSTTPRSR